jgi:hypothetical protein
MESRERLLDEREKRQTKREKERERNVLLDERKL